MSDQRSGERQPKLTARMIALVALVASPKRCRVAPDRCTSPVRCLVICRSVLHISSSEPRKLPPRSKLPLVAQRFRQSWKRLMATSSR